MNTEHHDPGAFDARMQRLHGAALGALTPQTLARLRSARQAAPLRSRRGPWLLATAGSALLAVGLGLHLMRPAPSAAPAGTPVLAGAALDADDPLDQNPDLYVWLGSENALAMEQNR